MKKKKTTRKTKSVAKKVAKKTESFVKKTNKKVGKLAETLKKQWKKEQPQRDKFKKNAGKALEQGIKIGNDVFKTIRRDLNEIHKQKKSKFKKK